MLAYVFLLAAATADKAQSDNAPAPIEPTYRCTDGSMAPKRELCPPVSPPAPPKRTEVSLPRLFLGRSPQPRTNAGLWVNTNDYPSRSLQQEEEGITAFRLTVGPHGRVDACHITASSGSALLDAATCSNIIRRARFEPALDDDGNPIVGRYSNRVRWQIPSGPSYASQIELQPLGPQAIFGTYVEISEEEYPVEALQKAMRGFADIVLVIDEGGKVNKCTVRLSSKHPLLDAKSCEIAAKWQFLSARDAAGNPVVGTTTFIVRWVLPDRWKQLRSIPVEPDPADTAIY